MAGIDQLLYGYDPDSQQLFQPPPPQPAQPKSLLERILTETWPAKMAQAAYGALTLPGDVYQGNVPVTDANGQTSQGVINRSADLTGLLGMGGVGAAEAGAAGIFGGRLAKTANLDALKQAESMAGSGAYPDDIFQKTGWFKGSDGQWRFEINDQSATVRPKSQIPADQLGSVSGTLDHPELFSAYPDLADVKLGWGQPPGNGVYRPPSPTGSESIGVPAYFVPDTHKAVLLHELQHAVQQREGFSGGSNIDAAGSEFWGTINGKLSNLAQRMDQSKGTEEYPALKNEYDYLMNIKLSVNPRDLYRNTAGEVEARNVMHRMNKSVNDRMMAPPQYTQDTVDSSQIHWPMNMNDIVRLYGGQQ